MITAGTIENWLGEHLDEDFRAEKIQTGETEGQIQVAFTLHHKKRSRPIMITGVGFMKPHIEDACKRAMRVMREFQRALDITDACVRNHYWMMGIIQEEPPSLADYTLLELVEANHAIAKDEGQVNPDGSRSIPIHCDDRLVAALYTAYHFDPSDQDDIDPIVKLPDRVLVNIKMTPEPTCPVCGAGADEDCDAGLHG